MLRPGIDSVDVQQIATECITHEIEAAMARVNAGGAMGTIVMVVRGNASKYGRQLPVDL